MYASSFVYYGPIPKVLTVNNIWLFFPIEFYTLRITLCVLLNTFLLTVLGQWDPQYLESLCPLSNTPRFARVVTAQGDIRILNTVDPLASVSNYYLLHIIFTLYNTYKGYNMQWANYLGHLLSELNDQVNVQKLPNTAVPWTPKILPLWDVYGFLKSWKVFAKD